MQNSSFPHYFILEPNIFFSDLFSNTVRGSSEFENKLRIKEQINLPYRTQIAFVQWFPCDSICLYAISGSQTLSLSPSS